MPSFVHTDCMSSREREKKQKRHMQVQWKTKWSCVFFVSSSEHEVLKVSYCDHSLSVVRALSVVRLSSSVVRRASSVVNVYVVHSLEATVMNLTRMFDMVISRSCSSISHVQSKTRSQDQISLKLCSPSRGQSFASWNFTIIWICVISRSSLNMSHWLMSDPKLGH